MKITATRRRNISCISISARIDRLQSIIGSLQYSHRSPRRVCSALESYIYFPRMNFAQLNLSCCVLQRTFLRKLRKVDHVDIQLLRSDMLIVCSFKSISEHLQYICANLPCQLGNVFYNHQLHFISISILVTHSRL